MAGSVDEAGFLADCKVEYNGEVIQPKNKDELQMLLARIVKAELGHSDTMENDLAAQKAQAIASYTYILYYNQTNKKPCPVSMKSINLNNGIDKKIYDAVGEVVGIKILEKAPRFAPFIRRQPPKKAPRFAPFIRRQPPGIPPTTMRFTGTEKT